MIEDIIRIGSVDGGKVGKVGKSSIKRQKKIINVSIETNFAT